MAVSSVERASLIGGDFGETSGEGVTVGVGVCRLGVSARDNPIGLGVDSGPLWDAGFAVLGTDIHWLDGTVTVMMISSLSPRRSSKFPKLFATQSVDPSSSERITACRLSPMMARCT